MYRKSLTIESCHYPRSPSWVQQSPREQRFYTPRRIISILITTALPSQRLESFNVPAQKSYFLPGLSSVHTFQPESSKIQLEIATNHAHHGRNFYASAALLSSAIFSYPYECVDAVADHRPVPCCRRIEVTPSESFFLLRRRRRFSNFQSTFSTQIQL